MARETYTFNKDNWTGETATLTVGEDGAFEVYDYRFKMELLEDIGNNGVSQYDLFLARVVSADGSRKEPIATGCRFRKDTHWLFTSGDIAREDANPYIAAAKLLYNLI